MEEKMKKKILLLFLALCMILPLAACGKKNDGNAQVTTSGENETPYAEITAWATHSYDKQIANVAPKGDLTTEYTVYITKGETEGCQAAIRSNVEFKNITFTLASGNTEDLSIKTFSMNRTHTIKRKDYTDSLIPYYGRKLKLEADTTLSFMIDFTTTKDTPAGDYEYLYELKDKDGNVLANYKIKVHVWDIVLPEEKKFATSAGINAYYIEQMGDHRDDAYKDYYDLLLEHNLVGHKIPYDLLDERADAYMSDPKVTSFVIGLWEAKEWPDEKILSYYNKIKSNPDWLRKAIFYTIDEPREMAHLEEYRAICNRLQTLCPEIPVIAPFYTNIQVGPGKDQVDHMAETTILWCPKLCLWDETQSYDEFLDYVPEKTFDERMKEFQEQGDTVWAYVCNDPIDPYSQLFIDTDGVNQRLLFWQCYQRDVEGFLYWGTTSWGYSGNNGINPWDTVYNGVGDGDGAPVYGEGFLMYPGTKVGIPGGVPSIRLKLVRDGLDDIELFYLAEEYLGKDWILEKTYEATPSLVEYVDNDTFAALRIEICNALEAAMAGNK